MYHEGEISEVMRGVLPEGENMAQYLRSQALFEKIFVCPNDEGSCEVRPRFAAPYGLIFGQEAPSGAEEAEAENEKPKRGWKRKIPQAYAGLVTFPANSMNGETAIPFFWAAVSVTDFWWRIAGSNR